MSKTKKLPKTNALMKMAEEYNVNDNALFKSLVERYEMQRKIIRELNSVAEVEGFVVTKEYVRDRENVYIHPVIKEMPRHIDSANKTAEIILKTIESLGTEKQSGSRLEAMRKA